jgi:rhodanese-related sulfurtransferase
MGLWDLLGGKKKKVAAFLEKDAVIIDVRNPDEYKQGHIPGARNIPLPKIGGQAKKLKKEGKPIILCCASGMRSGQATRVLEQQGLECLNGGGWSSLARMV